MEEFEEEWPVAKESEAEVWTSEVALEPRSAKVPEIGMKDVEVEVRCALVSHARHAASAVRLCADSEMRRARTRALPSCGEL